MQITQALLKVQHGLSLPLEPAHWALPIGLRLALSACPLSLTLQLAHVQYTCLNLADTPWHANMLCSCLSVQTAGKTWHDYLCTSPCLPVIISIPVNHFQVSNQQTIFSIRFLKKFQQQVPVGVASFTPQHLNTSPMSLCQDLIQGGTQDRTYMTLGEDTYLMNERMSVLL